ncbi:hypothetical protein T12_9369 [Trichinella patagoniensis]|uniref:Uncharacterized protein n=1 Tax=Trichinella patagoniensis TaxID=990121 RepID=A0A0V1ACI4_9BILA|nr:hypothetical protein T12_9369 [Trichinella patagoniensis]
MSRHAHCQEWRASKPKAYSPETEYSRNRVTSRSFSCSPICKNIFDMSACSPTRNLRKRNNILTRSF